MAVVHIKGTGSKSSGTSTADDWTDANCYPIASWATAVGATSAGDTIIFNDESFTSPDLSLNAAPTGLLTIKSRSTGATITPTNGTTRLFTYSSATADSQFAFENLTFDLTGVTWSGTGTPVIQITQNSSAVTFTDCTWTNVTAVSAARTVSLLLRFAPNIANCTATIKDCTVSEIDVDLSGDFQGLFKVEDNDITWTIDGLTLTNIDTNCTAGNNLGLIYQTNTTALTIKNVTMTNVVNHAVASNSVAGLYRAQGSPGALTVDGLTIDTVTLDGTASTEAVIKAIGTATIKNVTATELRRTGAETPAGNSIGGIVVSTGSSANVTIEDVTISSSGGFYGTAFYNSGGGAITARRVIASGISQDSQVSTGGDPINGLAFYSGGDGDATWESCVALNCSGSATNGLAWYAHLAATGASSKTFIARNCTFANTTLAGGQAGGAVKQFLVGQTLTATFTNCVFDNGALEVTVDEGTGMPMDLTFTNCALESGEVSHNIDEGTYTFTNNISGSSNVSAAGVPADPSPLRRAGSRWWGNDTPPKDAANKLFQDPPPIGAYQPEFGYLPSRRPNMTPRELHRFRAIRSRQL